MNNTITDYMKPEGALPFSPKNINKPYSNSNICVTLEQTLPFFDVIADNFHVIIDDYRRK